MRPRASHARRALAFAVCTVALAVAGGGAALAGTIDNQSSPNWAGWVSLAVPRAARTARHFVNISGSWVQPSATCTPHRTTFAAFWVGLGGYSEHSKALEQIGTEADCSKLGVVFYYAWYELLPGPPITIHGIRVTPGDAITASVHVSSDHVTVRLADTTSGSPAFVKSSVMRRPSPDTSAAEWIAEAPSNCNGNNDCKPLRLTDFGQIGFTSASVTGIGSAGRHTGPDRRSRLGLRRDRALQQRRPDLHAGRGELRAAQRPEPVRHRLHRQLRHRPDRPTGPTGPTGASGSTGATGA